MKVKLIVEGGDMKPGPAVAQQLGPMGVNLGKVISDVNTATSGFKGLKVPVEIDVNAKTKEFSIEVLSPPVSELIKKELGIEKGSGKQAEFKAGNIAFERLVDIARTKMPGLLAKDLKKAIKLVVGSCVSLGVLIDNKEAKEIETDIDSGVYDKEIKEEITQPSEDKKKKLEEFFAEVKAQQEKRQREIEAAKAAEEAAKAEAVAEGTEGAEGAEAAKEGAAAPVPEKKEEPKK
jgi:large subunit ribosomal protein L11